MERFTTSEKNLITAIAMLKPYQNNECMKDHILEVADLFERYRNKLDDLLEEDENK